MTPEQEKFVDMLANNGLNPILTMAENGHDWTLVEIDLRLGGDSVGLRFDPDGKLIAVDRG